jgi:hypothetical protein
MADIMCRGCGFVFDSHAASCPRCGRCDTPLASLWKPVAFRHILGPSLAAVSLATLILGFWALTRPVIVDCGDSAKATVGDLQVDILEVRSRSVFGEQNDRPEWRDMLYAIVQLKNLNLERSVDWTGWQGRGTAEDMQGHKFPPANVTGWRALQDGYSPDLYGMPVSRKRRLGPGGTATSVVFFEPAPMTTTQVVLTFPLNGVLVRFRRPVHHGMLAKCILRPWPTNDGPGALAAPKEKRPP